MEVATDSQEGSKTAYLFPGQGAQFVGMGLELYKSSNAARRVLDEADQILDMPLTRLIFSGPAKKLEETVNSQPAIMAVSLACLKAFEETAPSPPPTPTALAGHSLGEYTALVVAGALEWVDALRLVKERGRLMQEASDSRPGAMAAVIGLDETVMEEICMETGVEIANLNADDQIVVSGDKLFVAKAMDLASARGAKKTLALAVSGAFHSSLMYSAQEGLAEAIRRVNFHDPQVPIIANSTSVPLTTAEEVKAELISQLCSCVQWKRSVQTMIDRGVFSFMEFGPGRVLASLLKRIDRNAEVVSVADIPSVQEAAGVAATL